MPKTKQPESTSGVVQVGETPTQDIGRRLRVQNRAYHRFLKRPENAAHLEKHEKRLKPLTTMLDPDDGSELETPATYILDPGAPTRAIVFRLHGREVTNPDEYERGKRGLNFEDLYRAYKHTPHQPASMFLKYVVHRLNNIDAYDDPNEVSKQDQEFLERHKKGGAKDKNGHVTAQDLHHWLQIHEEIPNQLLAHRAALHTELNRGVGLNMRDIGGKKYIALSRGLNSDVMSGEHALSSWSDQVNPGFGSTVHHAWVPLNDIWYSYKFGPEYPQGEIGHEDEYLMANTGDRYEAEPHDVKAVRGHGEVRYYDDATDEELAKYLGDANDFNHPNAGPKTYQVALNIFKSNGVKEEDIANEFVGTKFVPREQALVSDIPKSIDNPNLTTEDLNSKILSFASKGLLDIDVISHALEHPKANADTARTIFSQYKDNVEWRSALEDLASSHLTPPDVLDKILDHAIRFQQSVGGNIGYIGIHILKNPNHTTEQADLIHSSLKDKDRQDLYVEHGKYSPKIVKSLADTIASPPVEVPVEPVKPDNVNIKDHLKSKEYRKFTELAEKSRVHQAVVNHALDSLRYMGRNPDLGDDTIDALLSAAEKHHLNTTVADMANRQNLVPLSESSQLRLLKSLESMELPKPVSDDDNPIATFAKSKGLAPRTIQALAISPSWRAREAVYRNKTFDHEILAQAWPKDFPSVDEYLYGSTNVPTENEERQPGDIYRELAKAIKDRREYAKWKAANHTIKPWPKNLAKGETDWWPITLREWLSSHSKEDELQGYYYRCGSLEEARQIVKDRIIPTSPTDEVLDGQVVFAHPAKDYYYHDWEAGLDAGEVLVYFETSEEPIRHDDRLYWPHAVVASEAKIAGIRPIEPLQKSERPFVKRELDPKSGYVISHRPSMGPLGIMVHAHFGNKIVGRVAVNNDNPGHIFSEDTFVFPEHRRRGLASAMYQYAERLTGKKMVPSRAQLEPGEKLWEGNVKRKQFGKGELKKHTFNGEKDYRPDESGDPGFPLMGGPKKENFEGSIDGLLLPGLSLQPGEHATALAQLGHNGRFEVALAAACFLARKFYDAEKFQQGIAVYGDERRAALHAVGMADSEKNLKTLDAVISLQRGKEKALAKSEAASKSPSIKSVKPGNEDGVEAAEAIERAVKGGNVIPMKLSGKHSKGAMACKDPKTGMVLLLKPPGGKQSPAAGARDGSVGQARREACFWHIADSIHLGGAIPRADLVILNEQEWSAIKLLGSDWKTLDERNREKQYKGREVLGPYLANGQVHRWGIIDWALGNTDSHAQNLLVNSGGSVALIDHGAAFAGPKFDPGHDSKSFIPFYLRVWGPDKDFKKMTPEERIKFMPRLGKYDDDVLKRWLLDNFRPEVTEGKMHKYGIDQLVIDACMARLMELRSVAADPEKNLSETVNEKWSGLKSTSTSV